LLWPLAATGASVALVEYGSGLNVLGSSGFDGAVRVVQRLGLLDHRVAGIVLEDPALMMTLGKGRRRKGGGDESREGQLGAERIHLDHSMSIAPCRLPTQFIASHKASIVTPVSQDFYDVSVR
jgi:hypothetical protein